jgi:hypothetical protein
MKKGGKGWRELMEKRRGDERDFIPGRGLGWQMERAPTPHRIRWVVKAVTGPLDLRNWKKCKALYGDDEGGWRMGGRSFT